VRIILHRLAHLFMLNRGNPWSWWEIDLLKDSRRLMMAFRCSTCGDLSHVHEAGIDRSAT
jgi:hypothetical protein